MGSFRNFQSILYHYTVVKIIYFTTYADSMMTSKLTRAMSHASLCLLTITSLYSALNTINFGYFNAIMALAIMSVGGEKKIKQNIFFIFDQ